MSDDLHPPPHLPQPGRPRGAAEVEVHARINRIFEMRKMGYNFSQIAQQLGYADESGPRRLYQRIMEERRAETVDDLRELVNARFDEMIKAVYVRAKKGELGAIDRVLKIEEQRARLMGLNLPQAITVEYDFSTWTPEQIQFYLRTRQVPPDIEGAMAGDIIDVDWSSDPMAPTWDQADEPSLP